MERPVLVVATTNGVLAEHGRPERDLRSDGDQGFRHGGVDEAPSAGCVPFDHGGDDRERGSLPGEHVGVGTEELLGWSACVAGAGTQSAEGVDIGPEGLKRPKSPSYP